MQFHATIFNMAYKHLTFVETLTEMGICYTYSGIVSGQISLVYDQPLFNFLNYYYY